MINAKEAKEKAIFQRETGLAKRALEIIEKTITFAIDEGKLEVTIYDSLMTYDTIFTPETYKKVRKELENLGFKVDDIQEQKYPTQIQEFKIHWDI